MSPNDLSGMNPGRTRSHARSGDFYLAKNGDINLAVDMACRECGCSGQRLGLSRVGRASVLIDVSNKNMKSVQISSFSGKVIEPHRSFHESERAAMRSGTPSLVTDPVDASADAAAVTTKSICLPRRSGPRRPLSGRGATLNCARQARCPGTGRSSSCWWRARTTRFFGLWYLTRRWYPKWSASTRPPRCRR
jgi:hypothetical protein